ncbi:MAG: efflux RND transporter periplasmic adaptor subunit [Isosphaeraceae bacterium]
MSLVKSIAVMAAGSLILLGAAALAQSGGAPAQPENPGVQTLVLNELAYVSWIERSSVAALREGVIEKMELQIGMPVKKGGTIGMLHRDFARLTVAKAKLQADSIGPVEKAAAQEEVAASVCARNKRLNERKPGMVSAEDVAKNEGELKAASAMLKEAIENRGIARAEYDLANQTLEEHIIRAPFDGIVIKRMKEPGQSVRANDAVVEIGNLSHLAVDAYVPLEYAYRVKEDQVVEIQPRMGLAGTEPLPIEKKRFRGKITFVDPEIQPVAENAVRIRAEFENPAPFDLRPGLKVQMKIFVTTDTNAAANPLTVPPTRTARAQ